MNTNDIIQFLKEYDGEPIRLMEVCGTHTAAISENAIPSIISPKIRLISGPGCPVCVTVTSYIDRLIELSLTPQVCVVTFGDLIRVPGSKESLQQAKSRGGKVKIVYSPLEVISLAKADESTEFVFAAVGFETTTPVYAVLIQKLINDNIKNVKLLTALKTMPAAIEALCNTDSKIDGFIAPGHVSAITGADAFLPLAKKYSLPFVVSGFEGEELLATIYALVKLRGKGNVLNLYKSTVTQKGNEKAQSLVAEYFEHCNASWRGLGIIPDSGMALKAEYSAFDAGSRELDGDKAKNAACACTQIITGAKSPNQCPLFGKICTPDNPQGACMVSNEGACFHYYINNRGAV